MATDPRAWLTEAQKRASKATEGPWVNADDGPRNILHHQRSQRDGSYIGSASLAAVSTNDEDAEFIAHARTDHPAMAAALTAVLDLHKPDEDYRGWNVCAECWHQDEWGDFYAVTHPCPTVCAITEHLPEEDDRG